MGASLYIFGCYCKYTDTFTFTFGHDCDGLVHECPPCEEETPQINSDDNLRVSRRERIGNTERIKYNTGLKEITLGTPKLSVKVFDMLGNQVATLMDEVPELEGTLEYNTSQLPTGMYNAVFRFGEQVKSVQFSK